MKIEHLTFAFHGLACCGGQLGAGRHSCSWTRFRLGAAHASSPEPSARLRGGSALPKKTSHPPIRGAEIKSVLPCRAVGILAALLVVASLSGCGAHRMSPVDPRTTGVTGTLNGGTLALTVGGQDQIGDTLPLLRLIDRSPVEDEDRQHERHAKAVASSVVPVTLR